MTGKLIGIGVLLAWLAGSARAEDKILLLNSGAPNTVLCSRLGCERIDFTNSATFDQQSGKDNAQKIQEWAETLDSLTPKFLVVDGKYAIADHNEDDIDILWPEIIGGGIYTVGRSSRAAYLTNGLAEGSFVDTSSGFFHVGDADDTMLCYPGSHADLDLRLVGAVCQTNSQLFAAVGDDLSLSLTGAVYDDEGNVEGNHHLSKAGAFASYTWEQGDIIYISAATGGVAAGHYYVASKVDADAILLLPAAGLTGDATGINSAAPPTRARVGLLIRNTTTGPHGAKIRLSLSGQVLGAAVKADFVGTENHADNVLIDLIESRYVDRQIWCTNGQSVGWTIFKSENDGSACDALFDFEVGGDLTCIDAYHPNGTLLKIGSSVSDNASRFTIINTKLDAAVGESPRSITLDCADSDAVTQVDIGGNYSTAPTHQMIRVSQSQLANQPDVQLKIKQMTESEARAYPIRPYKGARLEKPYTMAAFASTTFWLDPDTAANITPADAAQDGAIQTIADRSGNGNDVTQATAGNRPRLNKSYGINWRPSVDFTDAISGSDYRMSKASPVGVADGFTDLTVMAVFCPRTFSNDQCIVQCQNTGATGGFEMGVIATTGKPFFLAGTGGSPNYVTSNQALTINKPSLIIGQRDNATGDLYITVDGIQTVNATPTTGAVSSVTGALNIGGRLTTATWSSKNRGHLGEIFVDEAFWDVSAADIDDWPDAEARERVNYLRGAWGVW